MDPPAAPDASSARLSGHRGALLLSWVEPSPAGARLVASSLVAGAWAAPQLVVERPALRGSWADLALVGGPPPGRVALWTETTAAGGRDVHLALASPSGWRHLGPVHDDGTATEHGFASALVDDEGAWLFWLDGRAAAASPPGPTALRAAHIGAGGLPEGGGPAAALAPSAVVDERVCDCCGTAAATSSAGPLVAYRDRSADEVRDLRVARREGDTWVSTAVGGDGWVIAGCPVNGPALRARGDDVAIAWFTATGGVERVRCAFSHDGGRSFSAPVDVAVRAPGRRPVGRVALALSSPREAVVSWLEDTGELGAVRMRRARDDGALGADVIVAFADPGRESGFPQLAEVDDDKLLLVFREVAQPARLRGAWVPLARVPRPGEIVANTTAVGAPRAGWPMPRYAARDLEGRPVVLEPGRPVLLTFWATWCGPCRDELRRLEARRARSEAPFRVIAVSLDAETASAEVIHMVREEGWSFEVWRDPEDGASRAFGVTALPASFLFDQAGTLRQSQVGALTEDELSRWAAEVAPTTSTTTGPEPRGPAR